MNATPMNERDVTMNIKRIELCDLLLACTNNFKNSTGENAKKWIQLHDKLKEILDDFDSKQVI